MGTEEQKPAKIEETRTLSTNEEGDAAETNPDGQEAAEGEGDGKDEGDAEEGKD